MTWLQGGPYYELSILVRTPERKGVFLNDLLDNLAHSDWSFQLNEGDEKIRELIRIFEKGESDNGVDLHFFDLDTSLEIAGFRKSRLFVAVLSSKLMMINFWFFGGYWDVPEWNQPGIKQEDKPAFKRFFEYIFEVLKPVIGTMAYEEDCTDFFETQAPYPDEIYAIEHLSLQNIKKRINQTRNTFEYCLVNAQYFQLDADLALEGEIEYPT